MGIKRNWRVPQILFVNDYIITLEDIRSTFEWKDFTAVVLYKSTHADCLTISLPENYFLLIGIKTNIPVYH